MTDFPCSHPPEKHTLINGVVVCQCCHSALSAVKMSPHRTDFLQSDIPDGYRAGYINELVEGGKGWEILNNDFGGEEWEKLEKITESPYRLHDVQKKHRLRITPLRSPVIPGVVSVTDAFESHPEKEQVGGDHYARLAVQPFDLIKAMEPTGDAFVDYCRGCIIKYAARKKADMAQDLRKAAHYALEAAKRLEENARA